MPLVVKFRPHYNACEDFLDAMVAAFKPLDFEQRHNAAGHYYAYSAPGLQLHIHFLREPYSRQVVTATTPAMRLWLMLNLPEEAEIVKDTPC